MDNAVRKVRSAAKKMELQHPEGLQLAIKAGTFPRDYELEAEKEDRGNLLYGHSFFKLTCTETSTKKSVVSMRLDYKPGNAIEWKSVLPFVEIRGKQQTVLVAGRLVEKRSETLRNILSWPSASRSGKISMLSSAADVFSFRLRYNAFFTLCSTNSRWHWCTISPL